MIQKLLNVFVSLEDKTTDSFIEEVSIKIGSDIAVFLQDSLIKK